MIQIKRDNLDELANEHYENLKDEISDKFPKYLKYSIKEILTSKPNKLKNIANATNQNNFEFMLSEYKTFTNKKKIKYNAYELAKKLNVNVCPYCNRNYTFTVINEINNEREEELTRPEFDHFISKKEYPILALSFYNLIPSCHICNSTLKGESQIELLNPYLDNFDKKAKFSLKLIDSTFYHSIYGFEIELKENNSKDKKTKNTISTFRLKELYQNHKDIILELIQKNVTYDDSYIDELFKTYEGTLFKNREDVITHIVSNYVSEDEIEKRPLSKLIKDISKDLGLIGE